MPGSPKRGILQEFQARTPKPLAILKALRQLRHYSTVVSGTDVSGR